MKPQESGYAQNIPIGEGGAGGGWEADGKVAWCEERWEGVRPYRDAVFRENGSGGGCLGSMMSFISPAGGLG